MHTKFEIEAKIEEELKLLQNDEANAELSYYIEIE